MSGGVGDEIGVVLDRGAIGNVVLDGDFGVATGGRGQPLIHSTLRSCRHGL